ncbi:MAG: transcription elongation factor GreA [Minisyncoccota bacterium]
MNQEHEYLTKEKYKEFEQELEILETKKRKEIAEALEYAKSLGDLSENAEYHEARDLQARVEDRIRHLKALLKNAVIVSEHDMNGAVSVGSSIVLTREGQSDDKNYTIVGSEEADASSGKISVRSPLGQAVVGKKKGESFSFKTPSGTMTYKVIDIK